MPSTSSSSSESPCFVDLRERELLAGFIALAFVAGQVDRLREEERLIEPAELLLNRLDAPFRISRSRLCVRQPLPPHLQDTIFQ